MLVHVRGRRPRADLGALERDVDRIFRGFWSDWGVPASVGLDVRPDADGVTVRTDVPGVEPSAINVAVDGRALTISGARTTEKPSDGESEREEAGRFSRTLYLSDDLDSAAIEAECRNGVLTLRIPKRPEAKPRQIEVKSS